MTYNLGAELTALSAPGFGYFRPWYRPYPYGVFVGAASDEFERLYAEFSQFWQAVQGNVKAAQDRITSDPEYQAYKTARDQEFARHKTLSSYDDRVRSTRRFHELDGKLHAIYQGRKQGSPILLWETNVFEPGRIELLLLREQALSRPEASRYAPVNVAPMGVPGPPLPGETVVQQFRALLTALQNSAPFAPYPNQGYRRPGVRSERMGAEVPQRTGLTAELAPIVAPATGGVTVEKRLDDKQVLHVKICVDGKCYETSMNLAPAIAMVMQKLASWHDGIHAPKPAPETVIRRVQNAIGAAGDAMADVMVGRHVEVMTGGWLSDIGGAIGGTLRKLQPVIATVATGVATAYGGPAAGAAAAKFAPMITNLQANALDPKGDPKKKAQAQQRLQQLSQQAKTDPATAQALQAANQAVKNTTVAYHVKDTAQRATAGDQTAQTDINNLVKAAEQGDPVAKSTFEVLAQTFADKMMKSEEGAKLWEKITGRGPGVVSGQWYDITTVGQWQEIVGAALEDMRDVARTHASTKQGKAAGVIQYADGTLHGRGFGSLARAMEWLKHATRNREVFIYAAACDKDPDGSARIHDEAIGDAKPRAVTPNTPVAMVG